jgi:tetrachlorobenzoquinone reductase
MELRTVTYLGAATHLLEFRPLDGLPCTHNGPGSHIDLQLPDGQLRQYSLVELRADAYVIAVRREAEGGGASRYLHDRARVGETFRVGECRNLFPLDRDASHSVLIAGGIGITPLLPMAEELHRYGCSFELHYASRDPRPAFAEALSRYGEAVKFCSGSAPGALQLDIAALVKRAPAQTTFYCCGPERMISAFLNASEGLPEERVRFERFSAAEPAAAEGGFVVRLFRQQKSLPVQPGQTILECLDAAGVPVKSSCLQGICGSCETRVIQGRPDHRDGILSPAERASNATMMICCSGSLDPVIVLDL